MKFPRSAYDKVGGIVYFPRMLDKIRLQAAGELPSEYLQYMDKGFNLRMANFLQVTLPDLFKRVNEGGTDAEILEWAYTHGRRLTDIDKEVWNGFATKRGIKDDGSEALEKFKAASGFADRKDIETFFHYYDVDEKRAP
jgi:hypothetical protein